MLDKLCLMLKHFLWLKHQLLLFSGNPLYFQGGKIMLYFHEKNLIFFSIIERQPSIDSLSEEGLKPVEKNR